MAMSQTKSGHWATQSNLRLSGSQRGFSPSKQPMWILFYPFREIPGRQLWGNWTDYCVIHKERFIPFQVKSWVGYPISSQSYPFQCSFCLLITQQTASTSSTFFLLVYLPKRAARLYYHQKAKVGLATPEEPGELLVSLKNESYKCQILRLGVVWRLGGSCWYCSSTSSLGWENAAGWKEDHPCPLLHCPWGLSF